MLRSSTLVLVELFLAISATVLMASPLLILLSETPSLALAAQIPLLFGMFVLPIIASLSAWRVRPYLTRAGQWGWIRCMPVVAVPAVILAISVGFAPAWQTMPAWLFWPGLVGGIGILGVISSRWQERLLPWPRQRQIAWRRWTHRGWALACGIFYIIGWVSPARITGVLLGAFVGQACYHIVAQLMITRFARESAIAKELQAEYRSVWYNE